MINIMNNIATLTQHIQDSELRYNRNPNSVRLLAVSKGQPLIKIEQAIAAGLTAFGENYLQEALLKINALADQKIEWHFIGPIQSNKTKSIAENFSWVQSVSTVKIATRLNDQRPAHLPPINICLQINISHETTKSGANPDDALKLATALLQFPQLKLRGLMAIPSAKNSFAEQRAAFYKLRLLYEKLNDAGFALDTLSMGMSHDLEAAIAEGATLVRIGTAIFGERS